jgi:23S rRNA (uridine2552-2'-O)-methyltransferase
VGAAGLVIAVDLLEFSPVAGVRRICGDLMEEGTASAIEEALQGRKADLVLSDMAPNISGNWSVDQPRSIRLAERALELGCRLLRPGGGLVIKVFQGEGFEALRKAVGAHFDPVRIRKPAASRSESREMYLVAGNYRL